MTSWNRSELTRVSIKKDCEYLSKLIFIKSLSYWAILRESHTDWRTPHFGNVWGSKWRKHHCFIVYEVKKNNEDINMKWNNSKLTSLGPHNEKFSEKAKKRARDMKKNVGWLHVVKKNLSRIWENIKRKMFENKVDLSRIYYTKSWWKNEHTRNCRGHSRFRTV